MQYSFGTGTLIGRKIPSSGVATPVKFGALQGVTVDIAFTTKELYSRKQFPVDVGRGTAKLTGKAQFAQLNALAFNDIFFGNTSVATGSRQTSIDEALTITANTANGSHNSTFIRDLGVTYANNGAYFDRVSANAVGAQYVCNETSGVYTFNTSQNNQAILMCYQWTDASNGKTVSLANQLLGNAPTFMMILSNNYKGKAWTLELNSCMSSKLAMATRVEDHMIPDLDFVGFADSADQVGYLSTDE